MSLEPIEQIIRTIEQKKYILITTRANPNGDAIASALAFYLFLKKLGKKTDIIIDVDEERSISDYDFLPEHSMVSKTLNKNNETVLEFDLGSDNIKGLTYSVKNNTLKIRLFNEKGTMQLNSPRVKQAEYKYDLIVVLDTTDLESLGKVYEEHAEFFYHTPIINIDHQADNEHFGELNFVDFTSVSTTEIIFNLIEIWQKDLIDESLSTCLLTGIILESKSFQTPNITPRTLAISSELVTLGAKRELIIEKLFYNKPINTLQMWGHVLSNLKTDPENNIMWSTVTSKDLIETQTNEQNLIGVVEEMLSQAPQAKIAFVIYEIENIWKLVAHTHCKIIDLRTLFLSLNPYGTKHFIQAHLHQKNPEQSIAILIDMIKERWPKEDKMPKF